MIDSTTTHVDPVSLLKPKRQITGISAVLLPCDLQCAIHWSDFERLLLKTVDAGLTPAVNMDTGYVNLLSKSERTSVLSTTSSLLPGVPFLAGAFVDDDRGAAFDLEKYRISMDEIISFGGTPVVFRRMVWFNKPMMPLFPAIGRLVKTAINLWLLNWGRYSPSLARFFRSMSFDSSCKSKTASEPNIRRWTGRPSGNA